MVNRLGSAKGLATSLRLAASLSLVTGLLWVLLSVNQAAAQESEGVWNDPVNLSLSAGTSDPAVVVDSSGVAHAVWKEIGRSFMYARSSDGSWRVARPVEVPFGTRRYYPDLPDNQATPLDTPVLWAGANNQVHALWTNDDGQLLHSSVTSSSFANFEAWSEPNELASAALGAAAITDESGSLHVAFGQSSESAGSPAGIYYIGSSDGGETWSAPDLLYESPYFRSLRATQFNVQLASAPNGIIVAAWDNPFQERVYVARSGNSGRSWDAPQTVDARVLEDGEGAAGPNSIRVQAAGETFHLTWQAGHNGLACAQYHQVSVDGGRNWLPTNLLEMPNDNCSLASYLIRGEGEVILVLSAHEDGVYLSAWDGSFWGETNLREGLARFVNPLNFREVNLACYQITTGALADKTAVILLGCDMNPGGDIWALSADLESLLEDLAPRAAPIWQQPGLVSDVRDGDSLQLVADADGWLHAIWAQRVSAEVPQKAVHYSRWDGIGWSQPRDVLSPAEGHDAVQPAIALGPGDKIMAVWADSLPGSILFSQAVLARAGNASEWSSPIELPMPGDEATAPQITVGRNGVIYVAYAVPLNEDRGVYVTRSDDGGETWSSPQQVFDAVAAGWSMVDKARIATGANGTVHLIWTRFSSPPAAVSLSVHYSRSLDGAESWSEATQVAQGSGPWSELLAAGDTMVHRFWLGDNDDAWHQSSNDSGASWGQPQRVSSSSDMLPVAGAVLDGAGRPWLLQIAGTRTELNELGHPNALRSWVFSEGRWMTGDELTFGEHEVSEFAVATTGGGDLNVLFSATTSDADVSQGEQTVFHSRRALDLPQVQPTAVPTLTPTPLPAATARPTPSPEPTPTVSFSTEAIGRNGLPLPIDTSSPFAGPLLGVIPAAAVVVIAFFVGVRLLRGERRK